MVNIISYNINGIRAAIRKDLFSWLKNYNPDIVCFQEIKAHEEQFDSSIFKELGYYHYWYPAKKKGYSGVGIISKKEPKNIVYGTGIEYMDNEGRNLRIDFNNFSVMSLYLPSGTNIERLGFKFKYMDDFASYLSLIHISEPTRQP